MIHRNHLALALTLLATTLAVRANHALLLIELAL
jgi:hypothetical protein